MASQRTAWHFFFGMFLRRFGPPGIELRDEVTLSEEPLRVDYLLLRKLEDAAAHEGEARTMQRLWPQLPRVSVVEFKSVSRPYRSGNLDRLWGYTHIYFSDQSAAVEKPPNPMSGSRLIQRRKELCAVLIVPRRTPSLDADVEAMELGWESFGPGYWLVRRGLFALYVVEIDVAGAADGDDVLASFGHGTPGRSETRLFWSELAGSNEVRMKAQEMEGFDELLPKILANLPTEMVMAIYAPEERMAGVPPEKRLADLDRDHQALALPLDVLRLLPEDYLRSLSPEVQTELRRRLGQNGH